ncbi:low temperature requirement protein A [Micromonospora sp. NPDC049559]|uniref:low temperature requirement protein A n=1 Tax=Micromonospora sp. NPDC049559 TaxID=3155923 RepID=UPI003415E4A2
MSRSPHPARSAGGRLGGVAPVAEIDAMGGASVVRLLRRNDPGGLGIPVVASNDVGLAEGSEQPARPAFLELFFDLVYVLALIALTRKLADDITWPVAGQTLILFLAFSLIWALTAWTADTFDVNRPLVQAQVIAVMFASLVMAAAVPKAYGRHGLLFVVAYLSVQLGSSVYYLLVLRRPTLRTRSRRILFWVCVSTPAWVAGAFVTDGTREILWAVAIGAEYLAATLGWPVPGIGRSHSGEWRLVGERVSERYRQFVIIALGVSIFLIGSAFSAGGFTANRIGAFVIVFVTVVLMWRIYIYRAGELLTKAIAAAPDPSRLIQFAAVTHLIMVTGVMVTAVTSELVIARPRGDTPPSWVAVILGGPALFLLGRGLLDYTVFSRVSWSRMVGLFLLGLVVPATGLVPPLVVALLAMAVLFLIATSNLLTTQLRTFPPRPPTNPPPAGMR